MLYFHSEPNAISVRLPDQVSPVKKIVYKSQGRKGVGARGGVKVLTAIGMRDDEAL